MSGFTLERVQQFCAEKQIATMYNPELGQVAIKRGEAEVPFRVIPRPSSQMLTIALILPGTMPVASYSALAHVLVKANASVYMGAWILSPSSGELYFRVTVREGQEFSDAHMDYLLTVVATEFDRTARRLFAVVQGQLSPNDF